MIELNKINYNANEKHYLNNLNIQNYKLPQAGIKNVSQLSFKGAEALKGIVLAKNPFIKQNSSLPDVTPASEENKAKIEALIGNRCDVYRFDYRPDLERVLRLVKTEDEAELAIAILEKKVDNSFLYSVYDVIELVQECKDDTLLANTATDAITHSDVILSKEVFPTLNKLKFENPKKYQYLLNSYYLMEYLNRTVDYFNDGTKSLIFSKDINDFPALESLSSHFSEDLNYDISFHVLLDLHEKDIEAYNYAINSSILMENFFKQQHVKSCVGIINKNSLIEIEKGFLSNTSKNPQVQSFVRNSDYFEENDALSSYISQFKTDSEIEVYRAERSTKHFESVPIKDNLLNRRIRTIVKLNYFKTKKDMFVPPSDKYYIYTNKKVSLYDYITSKENLTLSDAMLVAKYADKRYVDEILHLIENTQLIDSRFKSTTFSERFVEYWNANVSCSNAAKIKSKMTIKEGTEGVYITNDNKQFEFLLNNKDKQIKYNKAEYDKMTNTFYLEGNIENVSLDNL